MKKVTKETKHTRLDEKRKDLPRLPGSRITDGDRADKMEQLYLVDSDSSKLDLIVDAVEFALQNKAEFQAFRDKLQDK